MLLPLQARLEEPFGNADTSSGDPERPQAPPLPQESQSTRVWTFDEVYHQYARFLWRAACRLGVTLGASEDVVQDTFLIVHRRLSEFEERTTMKAWLFAILVRVVRDHRRTARRKGAGYATGLDPDHCVDSRSPSPLDVAEREETVRELYAILDSMEDDLREIFVLVELEQLTVREVALALQVNVNTAYWRLRVARQRFDQVLARRRKGLPRRHA